MIDNSDRPISKPPRKCGIRHGFQPLMFEGDTTKRSEWPWIAALHHLEYQQFFCGGSLISSKMVVTGIISLCLPT